MDPGHRIPRRGVARLDVTVRLVLIAVAVGVTVLGGWTLWLAGQVGAVVTARTWPASTPADAPGIAVRVATTHRGDPGAAWPAPARSQLPAAATIYPLWMLLFGGHAAAGLAVARRGTRRLAGRRGFARRRQVDQLLGAAAVTGRAAILRPALQLTDRDTATERAAKQARRRDPLEFARYLGDDAQSGQPLYLANEYSELGEGVARFAGKTSRYVIPRVVDARGAVLTTSTRLDVAEPTFDLRAAIGPTWIFEPQGELPGVPRLRWSPIRGCEDQVVAMLRANGFASGSGIGDHSVENGNWFQDQAASVIRALLHAAALDGDATMTDVLGWAQNPSDSRPELILRHHQVHIWAERLTRHRETSGRTRDTIQAVVAGALDAFHDPRVLAACSPKRGEEFRPAQWLADCGTLYLVGTRDAQAVVAPLMAAVVEDILYSAKRAALTAPGGRCEPPLHFIGDEITNIAPIPSLPSLMSEGGGTGIAVSVFCQNSHQLRQRWGRDGGQAIEAAANARLVFGGSPDSAGLRDIQALAGQIHELTSSASWGGGRASVQESLRREPLLDVADLRTLPTGRALVLVGNLPPVEVRLPAWWQRKDANRLQAAAAEFRRRITKGTAT
jgi:hypothetical protein